MGRGLVKQDFRPLRYLPCIGVIILIVTLIIMYSMFISVFGVCQDLVLSRVLSLEILCQEESLLATFIPNVGTFGMALGFLVIELVFFLRYVKYRLIKPRSAIALFIIGTLGTFFMLWMLTFPTGRGHPSDLIHQITAGLGVFAFLIHAIVTAVVYKTKKNVRRWLAFFLILASIGMLITFVLDWKGKIPSYGFAISQLVYLGLLFVYFVTLSDSTVFCAKLKTPRQRI